MPYFGAQVDVDNKYYVTVKIHGPLDTIPNGILKEVKGFIAAMVPSYNIDNIPEICSRLAEDIKERYLDGNNLIWVQVEIVTKQDLIFGAAAERILVT